MKIKVCKTSLLLLAITIQIKLLGQAGMGAAPYCLPDYANAPCNQPNSSNDPANTVNDFINSFNTVGADIDIINNNSGCNAQVIGGQTVNYFNHGCNNVMRVTPGQAITANIESGNAFAQGFAIFIDWNNNGVFEVPGERVASTTIVPPPGTFTALPFTIPITQTNGLYRMRVRSQSNENGTNIDPCATATNGETEDYTIIVGTLSVTAGSNSPLCEGQTLSLTSTLSGTNSSSETTFSWSGPAGFSSTSADTILSNVIATNAGIYTLSVTANCTIAVSSLTVLVNPLPSFTVAASPNSVCSGQSSTLSAGGAVSYTWNPGSVSGNTIMVSPIGTTIYTATGTDGICSETQTIQVTVNNTPTVIITASSNTLCVGDSVTLTASGANSYLWSNGSSNTVIVVTPTASSSYSVLGDVSGCTSTANTSVTVLPVPNNFVTLSNPSTICAGQTTTLFASAIGATSYTWFPGALSGNTVMVSPIVTTVFTVIASNGSCTNSAQTTVSVSQGPAINTVASPTSICLGGTSTLSAFGALSYTWNPGGILSSSLAASPSITTIYSVTGIDGLGCSNSETVSLTVNSLPNITVTPASTSVCAGSSITLNAFGGTSYTWTPGGTVGSSLVATPATTTTYTVIGSNGTCIDSVTSIVSVVPLPTVSASASNTQICAGSSLTITGSGATTYTWMPGSLIGVNVTVTPSITTTYTVTGTSGNCDNSATVTVLVNPAPTINASASPSAICAGSTTTLNASGGVNFTWTPGNMTGNTVVISPTVNTTYTVIETNTTGCSSTTTVDVIVNPLPSLTVTATSTNICSGGTSTLTASGGISYFWNPGGIPGAVIAVSPTVTTTYTVFGTSGSGCINSLPFTISVTPVPTINIVSTPTALCAGNSATLAASGANAYTWTPGGTTSSVLVVSPTVTTTYSVIGANGSCTANASFTLNVNPVPTVTALASSPTICAGQTTSLAAGGATSFTWMPGAITGSQVSVSPLTSTVYTVTGSNSFACTNTQTVSVTVNPSPTITITPTATNICSGSTSTISALGASTYTWLPGASTSSSISVSPMVTTVYTVSGASASGCIDTVVFTISVTPTPTLLVAASPTAICDGDTATLSVNGAAGYTWNPGGLTGATVAVSPTVTTSYTVTGVQGICSSTSTITLNVSPNPSIIASGNATICSGSNTTLTASGGTTYTWMPGALSGTQVTVSPSITTIYTITGSNASGCASNATVSVDVNTTPTISLSASSPSICSGDQATLNASGASSYSWNPGSITGTSIIVSPSSTTIYTVTGIAVNNCVNTQTVSLAVNSTPTVTLSSSSSTICSSSSVTLTAGGANNYTWNPGPLTGGSINVSPLVNTTYTVTGSSLAGCSNTAITTITVVPTPTLSATGNPTSLCAGTSATLSVSGGTSYIWNPGALTGSNVVVNPTVTTTYTVTESGSCASNATVTLNIDPSPVLTITTLPAIVCSGNTTTLTANGANTYTWISTGSPVIGPTVVITPAVSESYTILATGNNGCNSITLYTLNVIPTPTINAVASSTALCEGSSATIAATGAASYTWMPGSLTGSVIIVTPTTSTSYTINGDNGGCFDTIVVFISVDPTPTLVVSSSPTLICPGSTATLSSSGAASYTWNPVGTSGNSVSITPTVTTTYTLSGANGNCIVSETVSVVVESVPVPTIITSQTTICEGGTVTLSAITPTTSPSLSYTWNPGAVSGNSVVVSPSTTITYTLIGETISGCIVTETMQIQVLPTPTLNIIASQTAICSGNNTTLTANGAINYTWQPINSTNTTIVESPTVSTTYTLIGVNGSCGSDTATLFIEVNPVPSGVSATSGTISCTTPSINLTAAPSSTLFAYLWSGPGGFTTSVESPTGIAIPGNYTLTVSNASTGCAASTTIAVTSDTTVPTFTANVTGTITCANTTATLDVVSSLTNASYAWFGPLTGTTQTFVVNSGGTYTITVTDNDNNCQGSNVVVVNTDTNVPITVTIVPATCSGTLANDDASIISAGFDVNDKFDLVSGVTYTGSATYATASAIPISGVLINNIPNPTAITPYTVRFFGDNGCFKDTTLFLVPTSCVTNTVFGVAKAVSSPTLNANGSYDVEYYVVLANTGTNTLNSITLTENLSATFPLPTTFSIVAAPMVTSINSSITINSMFDGITQTVMTVPVTSSLTAGKRDTIMFRVNITHNGNFGPFYNTVTGFSSPTIGVVFADSSHTGYDDDPDLDGNPTNNNIPTVLNLPPNLFFGITKAGMLSEKLSDNTFDITYTISIHNRGNDTLRNVTIKDSLFNNTIRYPGSYTMKAGPFVNGNLTANAAFNGNTDINLLIPSQSKLAPGAIHTIEFTINLSPDTITVVKNSVFGFAVSSNSTIVSDTSNTGNNPDTNNNGTCNESADNIPTTLIIPNSALFVPQGFSPNGDGKNDTWVIQGLPSENTVTIFNRWGQKVYYMENYDNTWNGYPNVTGTLGNDKLPQGTYYYIIEFKQNDNKPLNGFLILQY
jgi:gliding motility-associated-like protein